MAIYRKATRKLIRATPSDPAIIPIGVILHVDAGSADSLYDYFATRSGGIESHFHIKKTGEVEQYRSTEREADANYKANSFIGDDGRRYGYISVETQGLGAGEWNSEQLDAIKALLLWAHKKHDIPLRVCRNPKDPGVGYHTLFGAPGAWTPVAKSCPGPDRIKQFEDVLTPWMKRGGKDEPVVKTRGVLVDQAIRRTRRALRRVKDTPGKRRWNLRQSLKSLLAVPQWRKRK